MLVVLVMLVIRIFLLLFSVQKIKTNTERLEGGINEKGQMIIGFKPNAHKTPTQ